jgi:hypothetical protein
MKLSLLDSSYHQGGSLEPVAVAYKVWPPGRAPGWIRAILTARRVAFDHP